MSTFTPSTLEQLRKKKISSSGYAPPDPDLMINNAGNRLGQGEDEETVLRDLEYELSRAGVLQPV